MENIEYLFSFVLFSTSGKTTQADRVLLSYINVPLISNIVQLSSNIVPLRSDNIPLSFNNVLLHSKNEILLSNDFTLSCKYAPIKF